MGWNDRHDVELQGIPIGPSFAERAAAASTKASKRRRYRAKVKKRKKHASLTDQEWTDLKLWWGGCAYCGRNNIRMTKDCVIPCARGGIYVVCNVVPACPECNGSKGSRGVFSWMRAKRMDGHLFEARWQGWWLQWVRTTP